MSRQAPNPRIAIIFLDSCAFDPTDALEAAAADDLWRCRESMGLSLQIAHSTQKEIEHPNTPSCVKARATGAISTGAVLLAPAERQRKQAIHHLLTGNADPKTHEEDARHIFEASRSGSYFITTDRRILSKRRELRSLCDVFILKPSELMARLGGKKP